MQRDLRVNSIHIPLGVVSLIAGLLCQSCGGLMQQSALHTMSKMMQAGLTAHARETDLVLAEQSLAATVKLVEALLESDPDSPILLLQATQGFASYTYAFVEARIETARGHDLQQARFHMQRAERLYRRGLQYGLRRLSQFDSVWIQAASMSLDALETLLQRLNKKAVPALFWTAFCWAGALNVEQTALETLTSLPRLEALTARLLELDETYFYGGPHLLQAVQYANRPPMLGGKPDRALQHFDRARILSQERLLLVPLLEAQYYAVQVQDRELFIRLLRQILDAPETLFPEQALLNAVVKQRATLLLRRIDELFV